MVACNGHEGDVKLAAHCSYLDKVIERLKGVPCVACDITAENNCIDTAGSAFLADNADDPLRGDKAEFLMKVAEVENAKIGGI